MVGTLAKDFLCQPLALTQARFVYRYTVHNGIGTGKIHMFENTGATLRCFGALAHMNVAIHTDKYGLARRNITH